MARCPYWEGYCSVGMPECLVTTGWRNCEAYRGERRRLRTVVEECRWATRRKHRGPDGKKNRLDPVVWCHAEKDPSPCYAWPEDCPTRWRRLYEELFATIGPRLAHCLYCERPFIRRRRDQVYCCRTCNSAARQWRYRRRDGRPIAGKRIGKRRTLT